MAQRRTLLKAGPLGLLLAGPLVLPLTALAQATTATPLPTEVNEALSGAQAAGTTRLRFLGFGIYDATLWVTPGFRASSYAQHAHALDLAYLRTLDGRAIAERSLTEMQRQGPIAPEQAQSWLAAMTVAFPDVKAGDRLTGLHTPGVGARFWFNGQPRRAVPDPEFSRRFFGIWLADTTSEPTLRNLLLAGTAT
jgi:hypothetical protein